MLIHKDAIKVYDNPNIIEYVFEKYLNTKIYEGTKTERDRYYDHLGMIDTLGSDTEKGCNHYSYSCEGGSIYGIKINSKWFVFENFGSEQDKRVYVYSSNPFKD